MSYTRREFGKLALAACRRRRARHDESLFGAFAQAKPNSLSTACRSARSPTAIAACRIRAPKRRSKYVVDSGISAHRADGRPGRELRGRADVSGPRRWRRPGAWRPGGARWRRRAAGAARRRRCRRTAAGREDWASWNGAAVRGAGAAAGGGRRRAAAAAAAAAASRRPSSRPRSRKRRPQAEGVAHVACRWTRSRSCARCTTTPA